MGAFWSVSLGPALGRKSTKELQARLIQQVQAWHFSISRKMQECYYKLALSKAINFMVTVTVDLVKRSAFGSGLASHTWLARDAGGLVAAILSLCLKLSCLCRLEL
jgi:hypothetical protein